MNVDLIAIENEKKANRDIVISMLSMLAVFIVCSIYSWTDYYSEEEILYGRIGTIISIVSIIISISLNFSLPEKFFHMKKYLLSVAMLILMGSYIILYAQSLIIFPPIAMALFSRYYDAKFMRRMTFVTAGTTLLYGVLGTLSGLYLDLNVVSLPEGTTLNIPDNSIWIIDAFDYDVLSRGERLRQFAVYMIPPLVAMFVSIAIIFKLLSKSGNDIIEKRVEAAKKAAIVDRDLATAMSIQTSFLSTAFEPFEEKNNIEVFASMGAARQVGGDFYDFCNVNDDKVCIVIGDVSGKGIPAALFMVKSQACLHELAYKGLNPAEILTQANNILNDHNNENFYVTIWLGIYDKTTGVLEYANAGHVPPFISRGSGKYEELNCEINFVCGMMPGMEYVLESTSLSSGDRIFTCTDGVTDCANIERKFFGIERLHELLNACKDKNCKETVDTVVGALSDFQGEAEQFDDITMMMVRVK